MFLKNSIITVLAKVLLVMIHIGTSIYTARALGPSGKGALSLVLLTPTIIMTFCGLGIGLANVYLSGRKKYSLAELVTNSIVLAAILGGAAIVLFRIVFSLFPSFFGNVDHGLLYFSVSAIPFALFVVYAFNLFLGYQKITAYNLIKLFEPALFFIFLFVFMGLLQMGVKGAVIAFVIAKVVSAVGSYCMLWSLGKISFRLGKQIVGESLSYGIKTHMATICQFLIRRIDIYLIGYYLGVTHVGYYTVAVSLCEVLWYIPTSIGSLLFGKTASHSSNQKDKSVFTARVTRNVLLVVTVSALLLAVAAKLIVRSAFGDDFLPSLSPLYILLPGIITYSVGNLIRGDLLGRGKTMIPTYSSFFATVVNILLNILLIPGLGIAGAALSSSISYTLFGFVNLVSFRVITGTSLTSALIIQREDLSYYGSLFAKLRKFRFQAQGG